MLNPHPPPARRSYLNRYVTTGEARILNTSREVVGLTKYHTLFPMSLNVVKLSGVGDESIFMGVVRPPRARDATSVRVWATPGTGVILTADESFSDQFGVPAAELLGRSVSSLGPDIEVLNK